MNRPTSFFWHRDSIGRRLKIWLPLRVPAAGPDTWVIKGTHFVDPMPRQWEMYRADNAFRVTRGHSFIDLLSNLKQASCLHPSMEKAIILDTNALHRGDYEIHDRSLGPFDTARIYCELSIRCKLSGSIFDSVQPVKPRDVIEPSSMLRDYFATSHLSPAPNPS